MQFQTHVATTLAIGLPLVVIATKDRNGFLLNSGLLIVGSLLPDIDHPNSYIGRRIPFLPTLINKIFGHRGMTHSLIVVLLLWLFVIFYPVLFFLALGYTLHVIEDSFSKSRVAWLQPFSKQKFGIALYKTGSRIENVWFLVMFVVVILELVCFKSLIK